MHYEIIYGQGPVPTYRLCERNRLGVRDTLLSWGARVLEALFKRYDWDFVT